MHTKLARIKNLKNLTITEQRGLCKQRRPRSDAAENKGMKLIANGFPRVNNTSFVCPKLTTVYEVCYIRHKNLGTIMKAVTLSSAMCKITVKLSDKQSYL